LTRLSSGDRLMSKGEDNLRPGETTAAELFVQLIELFEEKALRQSLSKNAQSH